MPSYSSRAGKRIVALVVALLALPSAAVAASSTWAPGWDSFGEPLDFADSSVSWKVNQTTKLIAIDVKLRGAMPSKLYQFGFHLFCKNYPAQFGQFPFTEGPGPCGQITREGVTRSIAAVEFGAVLTDVSGDGDGRVVVGPVAPGNYNVQFHIRNGAGCDVAGGGGDGTCPALFQSPGPFGTTIRIRVE
jgi:hypothetical protein